MKQDTLLYDRVFQILKNKIVCGVLPEGSSLPSRADLCQEFETSEKTIRRALSILEEKGFIETFQRKRPVVRSNRTAKQWVTELTPGKIDAALSNDVLNTGKLLCYPVIQNGIALCRQEDLQTPRTILEHMRTEDAEEFWRLSKRFWRFFVARNENELSLRAVDSLGLAELRPLQDNAEVRARYVGVLQKFMGIMESGDAPESLNFDDMSEIYGLTEGGQPAFAVPADSAVVLGGKQLNTLLTRAEVRYSSVYMDLIGLIAVGRYCRGDMLPTHKELQKKYHVSVDTTIRAIQIMQEWGIVKTVRGSGIFVEMNSVDLKQIQIPTHLIVHHVRRYLDSLELLVLTVKGAAICAASHITPECIREIRTRMDRLWNEEYLYERTPAVLLDLIVDHIELDALDAVYTLLQRNFRIGRSIPALLNTEKTTVNQEIHQQCVEAMELLSAGDHESFSEKVTHTFREIHRLVIEECKRLNYYDDAMRVYDGGALWR